MSKTPATLPAATARSARLGRALLLAFTAAFLVLLISSVITPYLSREGFVLPNGRIIGADFITFYTAGKMLREQPGELYNFPRQRQEQLEVTEGRDAGTYPFVYPPLAALFFSFFSYGSFFHGFLVWTGLSLALFVLSLLLLQKTLPLSRLDCFLQFLACLAFFPFSMECLAGGQTSAIALFIFAAVYILLSRGREFSAGLVLSLGYYKPPLFLVFGLLMLFERRWRLVAGAAAGGAVLIAASLALLGLDGCLGYLQQASRYSYGYELLPGVSLRSDKGVGLFALLWGLFGANGEYARPAFAAAGAVLVLAVGLLLGRYTEKSQCRFALRFAVQVSVSLFLSLQMAVYDLTALLVPVVLVLSCLPWPPKSAAAWLAWVSAIGFYFQFAYPEVRFAGAAFNSAALCFAGWVTAVILLYREPEEAREG